MTHARMIRAMKQAVFHDAPEYVVQRCVDLFSKRKSWDPVRLVKAFLCFDSWTLPELAGIRSRDRGARQLVYQTDTFQIFIMMLQVQNGSMVLGQVVSNDPVLSASNCMVTLQRNNRIVSKERTNAAGEFLLTSRDRGIYRMQFDLVIYAEQLSILVNLVQ